MLEVIASWRCALHQ